MVAQVVVVNDDAAEGRDSKESDTMLDLLLDALPCRLAGGFTTNERVYDWLDKGASQVIVEYAASNLGFLDGVPKVRDDAPVSVHDASRPCCWSVRHQTLSFADSGPASGRSESLSQSL